uniref:Uncharacterized protein n=1 Tax=viral metagenome TaxID=1070528 RepID=A0A6C0I8C4_9ZZZZ
MPYIDYANDAASTSSDNKKPKLPLDKNFHRVYRTVVDEKKTTKLDDGKVYYKKAAVGIYGSGPIGTRIRNAVTGTRYNYLVGSADEDFLYSVALCTGENGLKHSVSMFYDSPEQYENHMKTEVDADWKAQWRAQQV